MHVRRARIDDAEKIARNNVLLAEESENKRISYDITLKGVEEVISDMNKGFYLIAEEEDAVIGQVMMTYEWSDWRNEQIWWLQSIYVDRAWRKRGVMHALLVRVREMAKEEGVALLKLYVHENNHAAMAAYEKSGMTRAPYAMYEMRV